MSLTRYLWGCLCVSGKESPWDASLSQESPELQEEGQLL